MASAFDDFVSRKTNEASSFDRERRIEHFRTKVGQLNQQVREYLSDFIKKGSISVSRVSRSLHEELLGDYPVDGLQIEIGQAKVELRPVGTILLGGIGRVDLVGSGEPIMIVLAPVEADRPQIRVFSNDDPETAKGTLDWDKYAWKIAVRSPTLRYVELSRETFQTALMQVAG